MESMLSVDGTQECEPFAMREVRGGGGLELHMREWGNAEGPPIVFVHGWSQCQLCWSRQIAGALSQDFRIVTFDLRGHGMSEKPLHAENYRDARLWAADLAAVVEQVGPARPIVVAWSYGGFVLTDYLRAFGESGIAGLNLVGSAVLLNPSFDHIGPAFLEHAGEACEPDLPTNIAAIRRFLRACTAQPLSADDWSTALCWNMVVPAGVRRALLAREITDDILSDVSIPVLVTHGRADAIVLPSMAEHVLDLCETAQISWYEDVGHMPFLEDAARFDRELGEFARHVVTL
jgi:pimeloyl-ACP methyl ester carboxylesterase